MKKHAVFVKEKEHLYRLHEASDGSFFTLFMFLGDGLHKETYFEFLKDLGEHEFYGNISSMHKKTNTVTVNLHDTIVPDAVPFITTTENLQTILTQWDQLRLEGVATINLTLDSDALTMIGSSN